MSDPDFKDPAAVASHTLGYLRRLDCRMDNIEARFVQVIDILSRQHVRLDRIKRDIHEMKGDMILMENNILYRMTEGHVATSRLNQIDERPAALEAASRLSAPSQQ